MSADYQKIAKNLVARAKKRGADEAEVFLQVGRDSSVRVRDGEVEEVQQATSKGLGMRVIVKDRLGFAFTSDFDADGLNAFVDRAVALANAAAPNKLNGLPGKKDLGTPAEIEGLFDPAVAALPPEWKVKVALETEKAAKAFDARITAFDSVGAGDYVSEVHLASSEGVLASYSGTYVYLYASPVASQNGELQTSYWADYKRFLSDLDTPESVGREAAKRTVRMLGAKKVKSQSVPVIFDPSMAASFVANVASAANGDAAFKKSTLFAKLLGKAIAPGFVNIIDDGVLARGVASSPVDGEGVATRRTPLIEGGVLKTFLYDTFTARKAKAKTTGNAARGYASLPRIGTHNLYLQKGSQKPEELIRGVKNGFYVTAMLGSGASVVTGEYSRGANGIWIENGELTHPVQEVTVAGNLLKMLSDIDGIGDDLSFRGSIAAPTLRFRELTVSGE